MANAASATTSHVPTISAGHLAAAIRAAAPMGVKEKEAVCDRVYAAQPNLLGSVLALKSFGIDMPTIDVLLNLLIVFQLAIEESGQVLATITEDDQDRELRRFTAAVRFTEGVPPDATSVSIRQSVAYKREPFLLAYVFDELRRAGLSEFRDETSKYPFLAAMNLVNCIAGARRISEEPASSMQRA